MKGLDEDIKNQHFLKAYLLYGPEEYLKNHYAKRLVSAMADPGDTMNYSYYEGKETNPAAIIDLAETMPFLKDRRVIFIKNSGFFKTTNDQLAEYLKDPCETTCFIFVEQEIDKRGKMYKACAATGRAVEMVPPTEEVLLRWAAGVLKKNGKQIRKTTLERLFARSGRDMNLLEMELLKLISYVGEREVIEDADVDTICSLDIKNQIFLMIDAMADGKSRRALELYYDLIALRESEIKILSLIARQYNQLLQAKEMSQITTNMRNLGTTLGVPEGVARMLVSKARRFSKEYLLMAVRECVELDEAVKTGQLDKRLSVELAIIKFSKFR